MKWPWEPVAESLRGYSTSKLRADLLAGLSGAILAIPQAMAYALIAGVDPIYGLYGAIIQTTIAALFSTSNYLSVGPTNAISLLTASVVSRLTGAEGSEFLAIYAALALLSGAIQLAFAAAKLGNLTRYVSSSVIIGFTAGAGLLIILKQVPNFLGLPAARLSGDLPGAIGILHQTLPRLGETDWRTVVLGLASLAALLIVGQVSRRIPGALMAVLTGSLLVAILGWTSGQVSVVGALPKELPPLSFPVLTWGQWQAILGGALAIALLGMLETVSISKGIAVRTGERIDSNREFLAVGSANVLSSFAGCFPAAGSFTRSALNRMAGGRTRLVNFYNSAMVVVLVLLVAPLGEYLPLASLAALLFVIGFSLIDFRSIRHMARSSRSDFLVCAVTLVSALITHLEYAIFIGVILNLGLYLRHAGRLKLMQMVPTEGGPFLERPLHNRSGSERIIFLQMEGDLFFGVAEDLQDQLHRLVAGGARIIILRLKRTYSMDATILGVLDRLNGLLRERDGALLMCGVRPEAMRLIDRYGLADRIGRENIFPATEGIFNSAKLAIARARVLAAQSFNVDPAELDGVGWAYEI
ncbi:MAG: SulP family inorganic anion transporter [Phycisphaeraceae bacterium]|nr:SulP family inorganic anion transporter [Phycisphaeraceae bacterium]